MRIAVVDIGTNSTRLLVADVAGGRLERELDRRTRVTRLGDGVDRTGRLGEEAMARVLTTCEEYRAASDALGAERVVAVLTSAVRDAANGGDFQEELLRRFGFHAETITGEREARLTYLGATSWRAHDKSLLVLDIGGGSTELVIGTGDAVEFHVSTQIGSVRFTERYLASDPPTRDQVLECRRGVRSGLEDAVPSELRARPVDGIAVAGTPTSFAAIDQRLEPYDRQRVHGYRLARDACERILEALAELPLAARRKVRGLHPDRAPTIVAGGLILLETIALFGFDSLEVSERDILEGVAIEASEDSEQAAD